MLGRGTLARRNGRAGPDGVDDDDVRKGVPSSDNSSAAEGSSGARGDRGDDRRRLLRQASLEAALSRARTTFGWALTLGRARILCSAPQRPGQLVERCGCLRNAGRTASSPMSRTTQVSGSSGSVVPRQQRTPWPVDETPAVETVTTAGRIVVGARA